jgi:hypothetical protein
VVVAAAVTGPLAGYEIGRHLGGRLIAARRMRPVAAGMDRAQAVLRRRGGLAVLLGRFVAVLRALMPAVAGTTRMPYRTFLIYNVLGGIIWGVGYCLLGYAAGSAYAAIERTVGTGVAIALAVVVLAAVAFWAIRRHRRERPGLIGDPLIPDAAPPDVVNPAWSGTPRLNKFRGHLSAGAGQVRLVRATKSARREDFLPQPGSHQRAGKGLMPSMGNQEVAESARVR